MALEFICGTLFTLLHDGVKQAMSKSGTFKTLLGDLKSTLDSLEPRDIQQIGEHNVELGLPNEEIESLHMQMEDGVMLVGKLSNFRLWNYCCLDDYAQQIVELDRALKRLLLKLKMQEARDVKEVLVLSRQNRDNFDEVNRKLLDIQKLLQQRAGYAAEYLVSGSNTETVPDQAQGNGAEQVRTFDQGAALGATFAVLWDVVMEVKDKATKFKPLIENLKSTLDSLRPIIEDMPICNKVLDHQEEFEHFRIQMERGVELVRKCSKVRMWTGCKSYRYNDKLFRLDEPLQKLLGILKVQVARDARETFVSLRNIEAVVKRIEESGVLQNQTEGWGALPEPSLAAMESDVVNMQGTSDAREILVLARNARARVEQIEGIGAEQNPSEIEVDSLSSEMSSYHLSTTVVDSASSFRWSCLPRFPMSSMLTSHEPLHLSLNQIAKATRNFSQSQKVGEWSFGTVYKAHLADGKVVFINRIEKEHLKNLGTEFSSEVELLTKINHLNLLKLLGYVNEGNERLIITEHVANGTLRQHLDGQHRKILEFNQRLKIAVDVAHALAYLHAESQIIHGDVKSSNILLTESMKAKVAYFGCGRLGPMYSDRKHISTKGYIDPEYLKTGQLTWKSDVFSFGILLIEIVTGRRPMEPKRPTEERVTIKWAFNKLNEGKVIELVDPSMKEVVEAELLVKIFELAIQCAAPDRADRPDMNSLRVRLQNIMEEYLRSVKKG